jgi:hypothetical protein
MAARAQPVDDPGPDPDDRIGLADLAAYRSALSGRPTADEARPSDPPVRVGFRDLWDRPESYRGRRVTVAGRLERTFRQGAVGDFPPLDESWIFSGAGDPICIVYPHPESPAATPRAGRPVRFTGTFLKTVRYAAGDGDRLAPLIVGDRTPGPGEDPTAKGAGDILRAVGGGGRRAGHGAAGSWMLGLGLAVAAALVIAGQHARGALLRHRSARRGRARDPEGPDSPPQFVDSPEDG